jgi:probable phosphoglycerate mutase
MCGSVRTSFSRSGRTTASSSAIAASGSCTTFPHRRRWNRRSPIAREQPSLFGAPFGGAATAHVDGGSRGNPGPAGYGVHIERDDGTIVELKEALGSATNNVAEYRGLLAALGWATQNGVSRFHIRSDSQLLVKQMGGEYRVKHPGLRPLHEEARSLAKRIGRVTFEHVRREFNKDADRLANEAMDAAAASQP